VDKSALSRWESGKRMPRIPELQAVLTALDATPAQRALVLSHMDSPRALGIIREAAAGMGLFAPPTMGDLLKAMRLRTHASQDQLASRIGVNRATVARWELGQRLPTRGELEALCAALGATPEESVALAKGRAFIVHATAPGSAALNGGGMSDYMEALLMAPPESADLYYLLIEHDLWEMAVLDPSATPLLARAYVYHGHYLRMQARWETCRLLASRALALARRHPEDGVTLSRAVILSAAVAVFGGSRPAPERGLHILRQWRDWVSAQPVYAAWALSDMAKYLSLAGRPRDGVPLAEEALRLVEHHENPIEPFLRRCDLAQLLLDAGQPEAALKALPGPEEILDAPERAAVMLVTAAALQSARRPVEGHGGLQETAVLTEARSLDPLLSTAAPLAETF
jgi:transcriptional regulator with XRE-family HTH domain